MASLYRNHFPEKIDFTKNSVCCDKHYFPESALVSSFVMVSCPCWHFTVILSPAENPACSSQFACKRLFYTTVQKVDIVFNFVGEINFLSATQPKRQGA